MNLRCDSFHSAKLSQLCYRKLNAFLNPTGLTRHWAFKRNNRKLFIALRVTKNLNMCRCPVDRKLNNANLLRTHIQKARKKLIKIEQMRNKSLILNHTRQTEFLFLVAHFFWLNPVVVRWFRKQQQLMLNLDEALQS